MKTRTIKARKAVGGHSVERITLSITSDDKKALQEMAEEGRVSIAWVIRDAISQYLARAKHTDRE